LANLFILIFSNLLLYLILSHTHKGVLRIHFLEAQNLEVKDTYLGGLIKGKSDPYGMLLVSNQVFRSKTIKECLHPKWNEVYEVNIRTHIYKC